MAHTVLFGTALAITWHFFSLLIHFLLYKIAGPVSLSEGSTNGSSLSDISAHLFMCPWKHRLFLSLWDVILCAMPLFFTWAPLNYDQKSQIQLIFKDPSADHLLSLALKIWWGYKTKTLRDVCVLSADRTLPLSKPDGDRWPWLLCSTRFSPFVLRPPLPAKC